MTYSLSILEHLVSLDKEITLAINGTGNGTFDQFWMLMSDKTAWIPLYVLSAVFLIWKLGLKKALTLFVMCGLTIAACDQTSELFKYSVGRLRPCYNTELLDEGLRVLEKRGSLFGFFSAHSADSFGFAVCTVTALGAYRNKSLSGAKLFLLAWAALVSISRVFVGKHYFGDVMIGIMFGSLYGFAFGKLYIPASALLAKKKADGAFATWLHKHRGNLAASRKQKTSIYGNGN